MNEAPIDRLPSLIEVLGQAIPPYLDKPAAFFGHSMGAIVSFELARHLRREHSVQPLQLFVSGRRAPHLPGTHPPSFDLPEPEFIEQVRALNGTPKAVLENPELMKMLLPLLRADFAICQDYAYTEAPPLTCPITALGGLEDQGVAREYLDAWRAHTNASFSLKMFPGDHFFLHASQAILLRELARDLHKLAQSIA
jgi:medium-chain acyl-[acyl-carrier-protein] hydrolase